MTQPQPQPGALQDCLIFLTGFCFFFANIFLALPNPLMLGLSMIKRQ